MSECQDCFKKDQEIKTLKGLLRLTSMVLSNALFGHGKKEDIDKVAYAIEHFNQPYEN